MLHLNENQIFQYNGSPISFQKGDSVMVNATEMAKPFGKRCNDFLSTKQTNELINSLSAKTGIPATGLVIVNQGGNNQGTWLHEDLALIFAQWLSPDFYLWCNDRIKELLTYGMTATQPTLEQMINNPDLVISLATQLKNEREEKARLEQEKKQLEQQNAKLQPKADFADAAFKAEGKVDIGQAAKKKYLFPFGSLRNCCTFAVLTVRQTLLLRRAAVNCSMVIGHFLCSILKDIRRLSIRSHCFVLRSKVCWTVSSVYGNRFSVAYNDLNANSHGE